jgi:hypothetical protein
MYCSGQAKASICFLLLTLSGSASWAQGESKDTDKQTAPAKPHYAAFAKQMNGVRLVGKFTVLGKDVDKLPTEEYVIQSVSKLPEGEKWLFKAQIKYGKFDVTLPLALDVEFAGDTPVITLTDFTIPALGTFSCRVVIYNGKYAGTWTHGKVGGHMFGVLKPLEDKSDVPK